MRYSSFLVKRPFLAFLLSRLWVWVKVFAAVVVLMVAGYLVLLVVHPLRMRWVQSDNDGDGLSLYRDLDPDGDGLDLFSDPDADNDGVPNPADAVSYASSMTGIPYDPFMGRHHDFLGRAGLVVCIDVPVRASLAAGLSFPELLRQSAKEHPEWFRIGPNNSPSNRFFYRRVRNYYPLFQHHPRLMTDQKPQVGDWAFITKGHIALVTDVGPGDEYELVEASPFRMRVVRYSGSEMEREWGPVDFFGRIKKDQAVPAR